MTDDEFRSWMGGIIATDNAMTGQFQSPAEAIEAALRTDATVRIDRRFADAVTTGYLAQWPAFEPYLLQRVGIAYTWVLAPDVEGD